MALATPAPGVLADAVGTRTAIRNVILVIGGAAFVGLAAQVSILLPFTPVPLTGQTFAVLLTAGVLGAGRAVASMVLYIALGMAGVPWFAGGSTAFQSGKLIVTFGYIVGFVVAAAVVGYLAQQGNTRTPLRTASVMALGNLIIYVIGATWLAAAINVSLSTAIEVGVQPFLLGDLLKILLAAGLFPLAWSAINIFTKRS